MINYSTIRHLTEDDIKNIISTFNTELNQQKFVTYKNGIRHDGTAYEYWELGNGLITGRGGFEEFDKIMKTNINKTNK